MELRICRKHELNFSPVAMYLVVVKLSSDLNLNYLISPIGH